VFATTFYDVQLVVHDTVMPSPVFGGGVEPLGDGVLYATGDGRLHVASDTIAPARLRVRTLPYRIPVNHADFVSDTEERVPKQNFRVMDILVRAANDSVSVLASHHYWNREGRCYTLRISEAVAPRTSFLDGSAQLAWRTVFDTRPCMQLKADTAQAPFNGDESGGRMVMLEPGVVLVTSGDMAFDGWNSSELLAQMPDRQYGKTIRVNLRDGSSELYTIGHRNPQGLFLNPDGRLWLTEHGPKGGDELNAVIRGRNYGWPYVTFGADYGQFKWPLSASQGRHPGYEAPLYAWLPSIGISAVIELRGTRFDRWKGDLLIGSLGAQTLYRVRVNGDRVDFTEPMRVGERIRDITEGPDGRVYLLFDSGSIGVLSPVPSADDLESSSYFTPEVRNQVLYATCAGCHVEGGRGTAPPLAGVVGRRVASHPGFTYSPALRAAGGTWTEERLDAFLANPGAFAPGTTMRLEAMRDSADRAGVIAFLRTLR
jgi:cytochrome c2